MFTIDVRKNRIHYIEYIIYSIGIHYIEN